MIFVVYDYEINGKRYAVADTIQTGTNLLFTRYGNKGGDGVIMFV